MKKRLISLLSAAALMLALSLPALAAYPDIPENAWYKDAAAYVSNQGIMTGTARDRFDPDSTVTRAQLAQILYAMENKPESKAGSFSDVPDGAWFADAVNWASGSRLVAGYGDGRFGPNDPVTREQLIAVLYQHAGSKEKTGTASGDLSAFPDAGSVSIPLQWSC